MMLIIWSFGVFLFEIHLIPCNIGFPVACSFSFPKFGFIFTYVWFASCCYFWLPCFELRYTEFVVDPPGFIDVMFPFRGYRETIPHIVYSCFLCISICTCLYLFVLVTHSSHKSPNVFSTNSTPLRGTNIFGAFIIPIRKFFSIICWYNLLVFC